MVYVDEGYRDFYGVRMCLIAADTDEELHDMAKKLGLARQIFFVGRSHVYNVPEAVKDLAIELGAVQVDRKLVLTKLRPVGKVRPLK